MDNEDEDIIIDRNLRWGWLKYRPNCLQKFLKPKWALFFICCGTFFQGFSVNGLMHINLPVLEYKFNLKSKETGFLCGSYNIASIIFLIPVTFFGSQSNASKPKWYGSGMILMGLGSLTFIIPEIIVDSRTSRSTYKTPPMCNFTSPEKLSDVCENETQRISPVFWIFLTGNLLNGAGGCMLYTLAVTYIEEGVSTAKSAAFLEEICKSSGKENSLWVAPQPNSTDNNESYGGVWWLGFFISGFMLLLAAIPNLGFPAELPALELDTLSGDQHDTSLFALWKSTKTKLDQLASGSEPCGGARALHELTLQMDADFPATDLGDFQDFSNLNIPPPEIQAEPTQSQQPALLDPSIEESVPQTAVLSVIPPSVVPISTVRNEEEMSDGVPGSAEYFIKKMKKKEEQEQLKIKRAIERKRKKEENEKLKEEKDRQRKLKQAKRKVQFSSESSDSDVAISSEESVVSEFTKNEGSDEDTAKIRQSKMSEAHFSTLAVSEENYISKENISKQLCNVLKNPTFVFLTFAGSFDSAILHSTSIFMPKILEIQFNAPEKVVAVIMVDALKLLSHSENQSFCMVGSEGCTDCISIRSLQNYCNNKCSCLEEIYSPVCGFDGLTYYSPCFAGCQEFKAKEGHNEFYNCTCMTLKSDPFSSEPDGISHICTVHCQLLLYFAIGATFSVFFVFLALVPGVSATLRCVHKSQKSLAVGIQWLTIRLFGVFAPVILGSVLDLSCIKWRSTCSEEGACVLYNNKSFSWRSFILGLSIKLCGFISSNMSLHTYKPVNEI
ncbi:solute carrier organic anion transporter family member 4A1-like [Lycorma delicatula]|uniref:solute carrier organic anion transporter family member 4A1-like n=1 Tax=Lycorma delicatula TaxID=130591 RepID=UPI003F511DF0